MNSHLPENRLTTHSHRFTVLVGYLLIIVMALRRRYDLVGGFNLGFLLFLLGLFTALYASAPLLFSRVRSYRWVYFLLQLIIVQILGVFQEYQDTWALLYIILGFQVAVQCSRKEAMVWFGLFSASLLVSLPFEFGFISGPGRALAYIVIAVLVISYDVQYARHEDSLAESHLLLAELQEAHQKLVDYAAQLDKLAALQERNRIIQQLYDSVGQKIFAIQLAAESTRLMLAKDPLHASRQIQDLQEQTQSTLTQMRQLIEQWRPL
jgi:signal transduction histidine kinase